MRSSAIGLAIKSLAAVIAESQLLVLTLMTYLGQSPVAWPINSEIGDRGRVTAPTRDLFRFLRYDIKLEQPWLVEKRRKNFSAEFVAKLRPMDNPANMQTLYGLGQCAAADQVKRDDLMFAKVRAAGAKTRTETAYQSAGTARPWCGMRAGNSDRRRRRA